jgi:hypothetical protein
LEQYSNCIGPQSLGGGGTAVLDRVVTSDVVMGGGVVRAAELSETNKITVNMSVTLHTNITM